MAKLSDVKVVVTSLLVSLSDVVLNLLVAIFTGSTVMLSQSLQGMSDLLTSGLLWFGVRRSQKEADAQFQFGYGREIFFWVMISSIIMIVGTGAMSLYFGYQQLRAPSSVENVGIAFAMLVFGFTTNCYSFSLSLKRLRANDPARKKSWLRVFMKSSLVETKATFLVDGVGTLAALLGLTALGAYVVTGMAQFDGIGSMAIGSLTICSAIVLMRDVRDLIVGRGVDEATLTRITKQATAVKGVQNVLDIKTMFVGSSKLFVVLEVHLHGRYKTAQVERIIDEIKQNVLQKVPMVHHIQVEVETPGDDSTDSEDSTPTPKRATIKE